ncbi:MAG: hypothetical protein ABIG61_06240 [Planctomycetota bacterium]
MKHFQLENPDNLPESSATIRQWQRDRLEVLRSRMDLLSGRDKVLMEMYFERGASFRQLAMIAGLNEVTIARQIRKLVRRLLDGDYITCLRRQEHLTPFELKVACDHMLGGLSQKRIAEKQDCTIYRVRATLKRLEHIVQVPVEQLVKTGTDSNIRDRLVKTRE